MDDRRKCPQCRADVETYDSACPFCDAVLNDAVPKKAPLPTNASAGWGRRPALFACPDCGAAVSTRAQACPQCGCPTKVKPRPALRTVVSVMIGASFLSAMINRGTPNGERAKATVVPRVAARGDRAVLACKGGDGVFVAFGIEAWSQMAHAQARRDTAEMERLVQADRISLVAAGTPVEVVSPGTMMIHLRLLAGPHENREGWVRKEFVRPATR
jgi:hypothetical protein